jgi:hypothetical protein
MLDAAELTSAPAKRRERRCADPSRWCVAVDDLAANPSAWTLVVYAICPNVT